MLNSSGASDRNSKIIMDGMNNSSIQYEQSIKSDKFIKDDS